ncbi:efflux transporter outer membrane subunit [Robertkochia solimangrovi]|uniref:efflux transporter outer membrane subunit n=1 Tax=Robertkochia solimangrovi TaxID=2213046 RepID=UPI00117C8CB2|nr:efflux transporter outer membrane subunit [Robertkochia solimangrovi]TRZ45863.1 TolC family protein [Robertkochia solimangrovi]
MKRSQYLRLLVIITIPFLLQSCFVAKNYERPEMETEALYRTDQLDVDSTSLGMVSWKELFTDPILVRHIDTALQNNMDIRIALTQIDAAEAYLKQGKAGYYPTVNYSATATRTDNSENGQFGSIFSGILTQYEMGLNVSWEADIWGKIRSNKRAYEAGYLQTQTAHKAVKTELVALVANTYYQLLSLDKQLAITRRTLENRLKSVETIKGLKEAGMVNEVAVKQTEAQLYSTQALEIDLVYSIKVLENSFSILLGENPGPVERSALEDQVLDPELKTGVPYLLLQNRPDVVASEFGLVNAFELTNVARSNFYPSFTLTGNAGLQSLEFSDWLSASSFFNTIIAGLTEPIFNGRRIRSEYEASQARQEQAFISYKQTLLNAGREVSDALYTIDAAEKKIGIKEMELDANEKASAYSEELLNQGMVNYLEVLNAQDNALSSELSLTELRVTRLKGVVELYRSLGGGWQ